MIDQALNTSTSWQEAVLGAVGYLVERGECFSSGEVARWLRLCRPDFKFPVAGVGGILQDAFFERELPLYEGDVYPTQVSRQAVGLYPERTPAGTLVFVYGPTASEAQSHDFEVYIPKPGETSQEVALRKPSAPVMVTPPSGDSLTADLSGERAYVAQDGRLYVNRKVVAAYCHLQAVDGNTTLHVFMDENTAHLTFDEPTCESKEYSIWHTSGRVAVYPADGASWEPGDTYPVSVDEEGIHVQLKN